MKDSEDKKIENADDKGVKKETEDLQAQLEAAKKEAEENLAGWQRAKADFLNSKKEQEKAMADYRRYVGEDMILALLPTVDSFDLAARHLPEELKDSDWAKGVMCIKGMFESFLRDAGVSEIRSVGEKFDPNLHEAVGEAESDKEEGTVIEEVQKGYNLGDKVIRVAKVKVAR